MADINHPSEDGDSGGEAGPRRIIIFGGTFDPPHLAHTRLAELAAQQLDCDEILFIPAAISPLKSDHPAANKEHRIAMLLLATADIPGARISTIEVDREGKSFTIDTLRELASADVRGQKAEVSTPLAPGSAGGMREAASGARTSIVNRKSTIVNPIRPQAPSPKPSLFLLIGADQAIDFHRWKDWQHILMLARPAVMLRPPWDEESFATKLREVYSPLEAEHWMQWTLRLPLMDVSATEIRTRLNSHQSTDGLLQPAVAEYIRANELYASAARA